MKINRAGAVKVPSSSKKKPNRTSKVAIKAPPVQKTSSVRISPCNPTVLFCTVCTICFFSLLICFFVSHGNLIEHYFFRDIRDTGMDFFHSIEYTRGQKPYEIFNTLYPPLANLFFYLLYLFVPTSYSDTWTYDFNESVSFRGTDLDLRTYQSTMLLFILFILLTSIFLFCLIQRLLNKRVSTWLSSWASLCMLLGYGCLTAFERGNIVVFVTALCLFFVSFYRSHNKIVREVALIALAVAAGLKLYPALLGILLLREKNKFPAIRAIIYGIATLVFPTFVFEGIEAIPAWLSIVTSWGKDSTVNWIGTGFSQIMTHISRWMSALIGYHLIDAWFPLVGAVVCALLCICALRLPKAWQSVSALILAMLLFQSQASYSLCLFCIPLALFLVQERKITKNNWGPFLFLTLLTANVPLFYQYGISHPRETLTQIILLSFSGWLIIKTILCILKNRETLSRSTFSAIKRKETN